MANSVSSLNKEFPIYNSDGSAFHDLVIRKSSVESVVMSLGDKISGEVYYKDNSLEVTMQEYIEYNGVHYVLVNPPTIVREGMVSDNTQLKGMTKYAFVFYHPMYILGDIPFTDVGVSWDEQRYKSEDKTFAWIGHLEDFVNKLNKNLEGTEWYVEMNSNLPLDVTSKLSDVLSFDKNTIADALKTGYETWEVPFVVSKLSSSHPQYANNKRFLVTYGLPSEEITGATTYETILSQYMYGGFYRNAELIPLHKGDVITIPEGYIVSEDGQTIIANITYEANEEINVYVAASGQRNVEYTIDGVYTFRFGQGVGLKNNSRTPKNNKIVTRIAPYGSETNIPYGYPQIRWYGNPNAVATIGDSAGVKENVTINGKTYARIMSYPIYEGIVGGELVKLIKHPFTRTHLMPPCFSTSVYNKVNPYDDSGDPMNPDENLTFDPDLEIIDYYDADNTFPNPINPNAPSWEAKEFAEIKPELGERRIVSAEPYNTQEEALNDFMSKEQALSLIYEYYNSGDWQAATAQEYMLILYNAIKEEQEQLHEDDDTDGAHVVIDMDVNQESSLAQRGAYLDLDLSVHDELEAGRVPEIDLHTKILLDNNKLTPQWNDEIDDEGNYKQSYFKVTLPQLDFDLYACAAITQEMQINMRSGACLGCTFNVMVDWDDYKSNFYDSEGKFAPYGTQRNYDLFPNSKTGSIDVILEKDLDTFGTIMPNIYQAPAANDEFVVLGISLPLSYIQNAESRLMQESLSYMRDNNVYHYEYPLKFGEHFLATHEDILSQIEPNRLVRFIYQNENIELYIKQLSVKYGSSPLPQYDITLTDDIEVVLNQIGQTVEEVSKLDVLLENLQRNVNEADLPTILTRIENQTESVKYLKQALQQSTDVIGGVVLSTIFAVRDSDNLVRGGMNGAYDETIAGGGIAAWFGGAMIDHENNTRPEDFAKILFRFDGSGYLASGNISWDKDGLATFKGDIIVKNDKTWNEIKIDADTEEFANTGEFSMWGADSVDESTQLPSPNANRVKLASLSFKTDPDTLTRYAMLSLNQPTSGSFVTIDGGNGIDIYDGVLGSRTIIRHNETKIFDNTYSTQITPDFIELSNDNDEYELRITSYDIRFIDSANNVDITKTWQQILSQIS